MNIRFQNCDNEFDVIDVSIERESYEDAVYTFEEKPCKCYFPISELSSSLVLPIFTIVSTVDKCDDCTTQLRENQERTRAKLIRFKVPFQEVVDRGFKECCFDNLVLANNGAKDFENDYNSFYNVRQIDTETIAWFLVFGATEIAITATNYGQMVDYGGYASNEDLSICRIDWWKVLTAHGEGFYQVKKVVSLSGSNYTILSDTFHLKTFSTELADKTIRFDAVHTGYLHYFDVDFKGNVFDTSLRVTGFFGREEHEYEEDNVIYQNEVVDQVSMTKTSEYQFQLGFVPECITSHLMDFMLMANNIYINDYNANNHSYKFVKFPVKYKSNKGTKYPTYSRKAQINLTFEDAVRNKRKTNC
jgi:hypothetical protein